MTTALERLNLLELRSAQSLDGVEHLLTAAPLLGLCCV